MSTRDLLGLLLCMLAGWVVALVVGVGLFTVGVWAALAILAGWGASAVTAAVLSSWLWPL